MTTVLLLHGFPQTSHAWRHVVGPLRDAGYQVLAPDLWGEGIGPAALAMIEEPVHLVGHDVGAGSAWRLAADHPDRVRSLTVLSTPHPAAFARALAGEDGSDQAQRSFYLDHFRQPAALDLFLADGGSGLRRLFAASNHPGDVEPYIAAMLEPGALDEALGWYRARFGNDVPDVAVPTLFVWGTEDTVIGPHAASFTADHVRGPYRFESLEGAGHWIPDTEAERLVPLVLDHVGRGMTVLSHWQRVPADAADWFDAGEIERGRAYNQPIERMNRIRAAVSAVLAIGFVVLELGPTIADSVSGWVLQAALVVVAFTGIEFLVGPWFDAWRELKHDREWELSTQTTGGFVADQLKGLLVGIVTSLLLLIPLWAVIRATDLWWLFGWLLFSAFTVLLGLLYPIVIAPLFNTFTPLEDEELAARILGVAEECGLDISGVLVADASRRSLAGNAYVAGLGKTRRVVVFDTLLEWPHEVIVQVVAHELGHWHHAHLRRKLPVVIGVQLLLFLGSWALLQWGWLLDLGGVDAVGDPGAIPIFFTIFPAGFVGVGLVTSWLSRADERQADLYALDVLGDPDAFSQVFRRLAETNKADVDPSAWKRLNASHPPIPERLALARRWQEVVR